MQIYTKILIGMALGALLGFFAGPNSTFLRHDTYKISDPSKAIFQLDPDDPQSRILLPKLVSKTGDGKVKPRPVSFRIKEERQEVRTDARGDSHQVLAWVNVEFTFTKEIAIRDKTGVVHKKLGEPRVGQPVTLWLKLNAEPLEEGGFVVYPQPISGLGDTIISIISPAGEIFMRLIKMVIVPLVFASLLVGVASLGDIRKLGRMGGKTLGLYMLTTAMAVSIGLACAHLLRPGDFISAESRALLQAQFQGAAGSKVESAASAPSVMDNILSIIPSNPIQSLSSGNMLQVIFFAVIFGVALTMLSDKQGRPVVTFFDRIQEAMVVVIHMVMAIAPFGVAALIAEVVGTSGLDVLLSLLVYGFTVLLGLLIHAGIVYGGLLKMFTPIGIRDFLTAARPAQLIAFSTSSSSATLPVTMECAEENLNISKPVASFVLPLGSTVNMDGTALYQGVAAIFIAQVFNIPLGIGDQLAIVLTATMASVGAAGVPGAGMVTLAMVLTASGIPPVGVALILGMDRLLDMFRTTVNVTGDLAVTACIAAQEGETLKLLSQNDDKSDSAHGFEGRLDRPQEAVQPEPPQPHDEESKN